MHKEQGKYCYGWYNPFIKNLDKLSSSIIWAWYPTYAQLERGLIHLVQHICATYISTFLIFPAVMQIQDRNHWQFQNMIISNVFNIKTYGQMNDRSILQTKWEYERNLNSNTSRLRYINNNFTKDRCSIPMDMTAVLGLHKFSLQATIDDHGLSMYSGHYTASINCCKRKFYCNDNKSTEFKTIGTKTPLLLMW